MTDPTHRSVEAIAADMAQWKGFRTTKPDTLRWLLREADALAEKEGTK